jgi:hypothetical protein
MATFTITTAVNIDSLASKVGTDTYNVNGGTLTIDQDSRYGTNANTSATLGNITISATLGGIVNIDGRYVRLIAFTGGSGNVPASNTTISKGTASGLLIGVWSSLTVAPIAAGTAMPATGFIKIKAWNSVAFTAGALTGITATASGADTVGWLDIVGSETGTFTIPRLGNFNTYGAWYPLGSATGTAAGTYQIPSSGLTIYCPGVWVETSPASGSYEFYANAGSATAVAANFSKDFRSKVCWISTAGVVRFQNDATNSGLGGFLPASGCAIRVPNIFLQNAATALLTSNALPNATLASRYELATTGGAVVSMDLASCGWYLNMNQPFSIGITNSGVFDNITLTECASPAVWSQVGAAYIRFTEGEQQLDPKGLTRFSTPTAVLDIRFSGSTNASGAYAKLTGTASESVLANELILALDTGTASGDKITKRSNRYAYFQRGGASLIETSLAIGDTGKTNVVRRWGYFDDTDGLFFELNGTTLYAVVRSSTTGSVVDYKVAQVDWNRDTLDGAFGTSNPSLVNLDVSMMNYYFIDFPGLVAGKIRFGTYGPSGRIVAHEVFFGNTTNLNYMRTASLPLTWEQFNTATAASPSRMKTFGGAVLNEGFQTPESQIASSFPSTWYMTTAKTCTGSGFTNLISTRSGQLLPDGVTTNRLATIPQKLLYNITGGPVMIQVRVGVVLSDAVYFRPSPYYSPGEIDTTSTFPASALNQGLPIITRIYAAGTYVIDPPEAFNVRGKALTLRSDGNYGDFYTFVMKPLNPSDTVSVNIGIDWIDV